MRDQTTEFIKWLQDPRGANMKMAVLATDEDGHCRFYKFVGAITVIVEDFGDHGFATHFCDGPNSIEGTKRFILDRIASMRGEGPTDPGEKDRGLK